MLPVNMGHSLEMPKKGNYYMLVLIYGAETHCRYQQPNGSIGVPFQKYRQKYHRQTIKKLNLMLNT
jgi:hypothetical protein